MSAETPKNNENCGRSTGKDQRDLRLRLRGKRARVLLKEEAKDRSQPVVSGWRVGLGRCSNFQQLSLRTFALRICNSPKPLAHTIGD
jgi:hypothetical protein